MLLYVFLFIIGASIGSFLGVLADRLPNNENPLKGRSHCDNCKKELDPRDLIPLLSFVWLKGRCRYCSSKISLYYPAIELTTAVSCVFVYYFSGLSLVSIYNLIIICGLIVIFFSDLKYGIIPNSLVALLFAATSFWLIINLQPASSAGGSSIINHFLAAIGAFTFFLLIFIITKGRGMGFGDVKFAFWIGLALGFPLSVFALYLAFLTGAGVSIILILTGKKRFKKSTVAFGPFLAFATLISIYFGPKITEIFTGLLQIK